jgi:hypothetical protein
MKEETNKKIEEFMKRFEKESHNDMWVQPKYMLCEL